MQFVWRELGERLVTRWAWPLSAQVRARILSRAPQHQTVMTVSHAGGDDANN
jgi:hypothetical protein